ncbi:hypothetical protein [Bradyrhizobium sp. LB11.1]|uniref:hypothetical protein n=1 Tax=Bradyrhizobium sp. LB11.1 TaxID=3156326 RepID=UPI0033985381
MWNGVRIRPAPRPGAPVCRSAQAAAALDLRSAFQIHGRGYYWLTIMAVRAARTAAGDFLAGRHVLGLATSTLVTGISFAALLTAWKEPAEPQRARTGS